MASLADAMRYLAGMDPDRARDRNRAGFSAADSQPGHRLARLAQWSRTDWQRAREYVHRYRAQLAAAGFDLAALLAEPPPAEQPVQGNDVAPLVARLPGRCACCGGLIPAGERFRWGGQRGQRCHLVCPAPAAIEAGAPISEPAGIEPRPQDHAGEPLLSARDVLGPGGAIARALPSYEARAPQLRLAELVERGLGEGRHVVAEAGTGTGKSLAGLVPAILHARRTSQKVLVSTAVKALQEQYLADLAFLERVVPVPFGWALLKGRGNYVCRQRLAEIRAAADGTLSAEFGFRSPEAAAAWPALAAWIEASDSGDLETYEGPLPAELRADLTVDADGCLGSRCPLHAECFAERARARAARADVIVINHALLLRDTQLRAASEGHAAVLPEAQVVIVDEAHHLEDVATDAYGAELAVARWERLARRIARLAEGARWDARLEAVTGALDALFGSIEQRLVRAGATTQRLGDETALAQPALAALDRLALAMLNPPAELGDSDAVPRQQWETLRKQVGALASTLRLVALPLGDGAAREIVRYAEIAGANGQRRLLLKAKPIEVADRLRAELFGRYRSVVALSATLATADGLGYWRGRVGCDQALELVVASPFDYPRQALLYLPADAEALDPQRARKERREAAYTARLAEEMLALVRASSGGAFLLFTSLGMLDAIYQRIAPTLRRRWTVLRQGEAPRALLVQRFRQDGNAVLFGVKTFWEGISVEGTALRLVVIDKLPFNPPDDPVWAARCEAADRRAGRELAWFTELALPAATLALKQGFGRLIRTRRDRGVVAILDGRLVTRGYGERILRALPPASRMRDPGEVQRFLGTAG
jgi:ATP-dependent DNA helicase DinG